MSAFAALLIGFVSITMVTCAPAAFARAVYVSPDGDDTQDGSQTLPWKTLRASFARLEAGDTLNVRSGRYCEDLLVLELNGRAESPIVIRSAPGERAWIGGGGCSFMEPGEGAWELIDEEREIYAARESFSSDATGGWLIDQGIQLLPYSDRALFTSAGHGVRGYIGPGFFIEKRRLQVRLQAVEAEQENEAADSGEAFPVQSDPNELRFFFSGGKGPTLKIQKSSHVLFQDLDLAPGDRRTVEITGDSHHVTLDHCNVLVRTLGLVAQKGTHDLAVRDGTFRMGFPPWVAWGDVKGGSRGAGFNPADDAGWNSFAIVGVWRNGTIERNLFFDCFDAVFLRQGSEKVLIAGNTVVRSRDDAIDLSPGVSQIEIADNLLWRCFEGISLVGDQGGGKGGGKGGEVYVHHNIIDVSAKHFAERKKDAAYFKDPWSPGIPFGRHDCGPQCKGARWRLYNNTIVAQGKLKLVPVDMPLGVLTNNLFADPEETSSLLNWKKMDEADFSDPREMRKRYRPAASGRSVQRSPAGASSWPGFDPQTLGAVSGAGDE